MNKSQNLNIASFAHSFDYLKFVYFSIGYCLF